LSASRFGDISCDHGMDLKQYGTGFVKMVDQIVDQLSNSEAWNGWFHSSVPEAAVSDNASLLFARLEQRYLHRFSL
jgi:hypothetical protein